MSETICSRCNAQSPENALYCQQCGQPLRCKSCNTALLPNARACIQCGQLIPERSDGEQFYVGMNVVPPGYNRLKLHETPDVRDVDLTVSDEAIAKIGDFLPSLVGTRPKGRHDSSVDHQPYQ
jgi:Double zinc ribbon